MRIDVHTHLAHPDFLKHLQGRSSIPNAVLEGGTYFVNCASYHRQEAPRQICDVDAKLREMEEMKADVSVLTHGIPGPELLGGKEADDWASRINDHIAEVVQAYPDKFIGMGSIGFGSPERCIAEVDRCINQLGFKGIQIFSTINHKVLDSPEFMPVYRHIGSLGMTLNMHPTSPLNYAGMENSPLLGGMAFVFDTSLAAIRLITSGLFDQHPDVKLIVPHVGGILPYLQGRILRGVDAWTPPSPQPKLAHPLKHYLDGIYVDTVGHSLEALDFCYRVCGAERLLFGTDHPFGDFKSVAALMDQVDWSEADRELIDHGNTERLLGL